MIAHITLETTSVEETEHLKDALLAHAKTLFAEGKPDDAAALIAMRMRVTRAVAQGAKSKTVNSHHAKN